MVRLTPNIVLLDIDYNDDFVKDNGVEHADSANKIIVDKIIDCLKSNFFIENVTVIKTGNGRHILVPFGFTKPFEYVQEMRQLLDCSSRHRKMSNNILSESFLSFAKKYLSDD